MLLLAATIILVALIFDYLNGFHDAANSIATVVATKVLKPFQAVAWAAFFNFIAAFLFSTHVAKTIGKDVVDVSAMGNDVFVILGGLLGAIAWNLITWYFGLPTSSSHALIGGIIGAVLMKMRDTDVLLLHGIYKIIAFIVLSPLIGLVLGYGIMKLVGWICWRMPPGRVDKYFRSLQLLSAASFSLGHGLNDAQKTMGVIMMLMFILPKDGTVPHWLTMVKSEHPAVPLWVVLSCQAAIALGTLTGGWRIVRTMGLRITKLKPVGGFSAETAAAISIIGVSVFGIPVSTTHTITGAIVGVGATNRLSAIRWGVAGRIVWAWILTIPMSALVAALAYGGLAYLTR
jgi:inorganic phosphate transporter, PiT family